MITATSVVSLFPRASLVEGLSYNCSPSRPYSGDRIMYWRRECGGNNHLQKVTTFSNMPLTKETYTGLRQFGDPISFVLTIDCGGERPCRRSFKHSTSNVLKQQGWDVNPRLLEAFQSKLLLTSFEVLNSRTHVPTGASFLKVCDPMLGRWVCAFRISICEIVNCVVVRKLPSCILLEGHCYSPTNVWFRCNGNRP